MTTVVDYYAPHGKDFMECLAWNGISGIARYLTNSPTDIRQITPQEVKDAHDTGLEVHFFYEMNPTYAGYFTFAQGAEDCRQAVDRLRELGAPLGTVVYFAVDAPTSKVPVDVLDEYFKGVESMATPQIAPGLYGFEAHVQYARTRFPAIGKHLAQTYGTARGHLDLWQHEQLAICGVSVDLNDVTVAGWSAEEGDVSLRDDFEAYKKETDATIEAMKLAYNPLYHHVHLPGEITPSASSEPLVPPAEGAKYAGSSADGSQILWLYPDGTVHP